MEDSFEIPKSYDPKLIESSCYEAWELSGAFIANPYSEKPAYSIIMPPPNVTGVLHMGHALVNILQDTLIRWKRMSGYEVLWVPGTDHAGIATQSVVERHLEVSLGKKRYHFSREEFLEHVFSWKEQCETTILSQLKKLGCSCDWSRLRFTMDRGSNFAVKKVFKSFFDQGLIARSNYLVNWDPVTETALADDEVEYEDREGFLWYIHYPVIDSEEVITVATTRPETLFGDTAVAVSPDDPRYVMLKNKQVQIPLSGRKIPIIEDYRIDPMFGTGAVKITPAHDFNDHLIGRDHNLPSINILLPNGRLNELGGSFSGMTMEEARQAVVNALREQGFLAKKEAHSMHVGVSYRSGAVIEPFLSDQWFVKVESFVPWLRDVIESSQVKLFPENWEITYFRWIDNLRDWCISRQLWWGHRIPIWYNKTDPTKMICYIEDGEPEEVKNNPNDWYQDEDVLDTWFSSGLWPLTCFNWPDENSPEWKKFYPSAVLVTGHDILFFWVARMLLMGGGLTKKSPFEHVFLHGLIYGKSYKRKNIDGSLTYVTGEEKYAYDTSEKPVPVDVFSKWEKLSKSKGNVIDPIDVIAKYGTDAVRMTLCSCANQSPQIDLDYRRFEEFKNFINKIWNGARFVLMNLEDLSGEDFSEGLDHHLFSLEDEYMFSILNRLCESTNQDLSGYSFDKASINVYEFFWNDFCSNYLEIIKPYLFSKHGTSQERKNKQKILLILLTCSIGLMHPFIPFITEELFGLLKKKMTGLQKRKGADVYTTFIVDFLLSPSCMQAPYPQVLRKKDISKNIEEDFAVAARLVATIRKIRGEMGISVKTPVDVILVCKNMKKGNLYAPIVKSLIRAHQFTLTKEEPVEAFGSHAFTDGIKVIVILPEEMADKELERLNKELTKIIEQQSRVAILLANSEFMSKADSSLVDKKKKLIESLRQEEIFIKDKIQLMNINN
ncbi:Valine--tRNA ligase [Candidatus Clavichlamydia salmonicola]|uniref:valine--tRNA ligase n=1 Tax=Candidatus Clavichlamydia salmonicola TaxID=469812 RepID=UPI0018913F56|nr:valine--tRNA ligase [Candidatus Clavichlamydia salmonicola]MBF5051116.1 Valine--tRNA ligase [Candidatus Clavichlamydia salmonicola]